VFDSQQRCRCPGTKAHVLQGNYFRTQQTRDGNTLSWRIASSHFAGNQSTMLYSSRAHLADGLSRWGNPCSAETCGVRRGHHNGLDAFSGLPLSRRT
jgi:hypothetical protein